MTLQLGDVVIFHHGEEAQEVAPAMVVGGPFEDGVPNLQVYMDGGHVNARSDGGVGMVSAEWSGFTFAERQSGTAWRRAVRRVVKGEPKTGRWSPRSAAKKRRSRGV